MESETVELREIHTGWREWSGAGWSVAEHRVMDVCTATDKSGGRVLAPAPPCTATRKTRVDRHSVETLPGSCQAVHVCRGTITTFGLHDKRYAEYFAWSRNTTSSTVHCKHTCLVFIFRTLSNI